MSTIYPDFVGTSRMQSLLFPAHVMHYKAWLIGYVNNGGKISCYLDSSFSEENFLVSSGNFVVDETVARKVIVFPGKLIIPRKRGIGRNNIYVMEGSKHIGKHVNKKPWIPLFNDPELLDIANYL